MGGSVDVCEHLMNLAGRFAHAIVVFKGDRRNRTAVFSECDVTTPYTSTVGQV
jgi:hypothetical protein